MKGRGKANQGLYLDIGGDYSGGGGKKYPPSSHHVQKASYKKLGYRKNLSYIYVLPQRETITEFLQGKCLFKKYFVYSGIIKNNKNKGYDKHGKKVGIGKDLQRVLYE